MRKKRDATEVTERWDAQRAARVQNRLSIDRIVKLQDLAHSLRRKAVSELIVQRICAEVMSKPDEVLALLSQLALDGSAMDIISQFFTIVKVDGMP